MKIYLNTLTPTKYQQNYNFNFEGNSQKYRKTAKEKLTQNTLTETNLSNLKKLAEGFDNVGFSYEAAKKAAKMNLFMLVQKPETMIKNIKEGAEKFKIHGISEKIYLECALKNPSLFSSSAERIEKNMKKNAALFAYDGLSVKQLFRAAVTNPHIFSLKPENINKSINQINKKLNISRPEIIEMFCKQPFLFNCSSKSIIEKFNFLIYIEKNKFINMPMPSIKELNQKVLNKNLTNSMENNSLILLRNLISNNMRHGEKLPHKHIKEVIEEFIKNNSNNTINIQIKDGEYAKIFSKFVKNYSKSIIGKNIFKIKII